MAKIEKFLRKLSIENRKIAKDILIKILSGNLQGLDVKKLKGYTNLFRIRKGNIRIVFHHEDGNINVIFIGMRGDSKYKQF